MSEMESKISRMGSAEMAGAYISIAKLEVTADILVLVAPMMLRYEFSPEQVVSIDPVARISILGTGIRIRHTVRDYSPLVVFQGIRGVESLMRSIASVGFVPSGDAREERTPRPFPLRIGVALGLAAICIVLLLLGRWGSGVPVTRAALMLPAALLLVASVLIDQVPRLRALATHPEATREEVRFAMRLWILVSAMLLVAGAFLGSAGDL